MEKRAGVSESVRETFFFLNGVGSAGWLIAGQRWELGAMDGPAK